MRKRLVPDSVRENTAENWFELEHLATVEVTSEDPAHPVESAFYGTNESGWRAGQPGAQTLRLIFDQPQDLSRIQLSVREQETPRFQEFALRFSSDGGNSFQEIVRQQWNFDPRGSTLEVEDYRVRLREVGILELEIVPDKNGGEAFASLAGWRVA